MPLSMRGVQLWQRLIPYTDNMIRLVARGEYRLARLAAISIRSTFHHLDQLDPTLDRTLSEHVIRHISSVVLVLSWNLNP